MHFFRDFRLPLSRRGRKWAQRRRHAAIYKKMLSIARRVSWRATCEMVIGGHELLFHTRRPADFVSAREFYWLPHVWVCGGQWVTHFSSPPTDRPPSHTHKLVRRHLAHPMRTRRRPLHNALIDERPSERESKSWHWEFTWRDVYYATYSTGKNNCFAMRLRKVCLHKNEPKSHLERTYIY